MKFEVSARITTSKPASTVISKLEEKFRRVANRVTKRGNTLDVYAIQATFGSINRTDITVVRLEPRDYGFLCVADVYYRPSGAFWILLMILVFTAFGWLLPIFFYLNQQKMVRSAIEDVFTLAKNEVEYEFNDGVNTKKCPACAENIKLEALVCRFCGHKFDPKDVQDAIRKPKDDFEWRRQTHTPEEKDSLTPEEIDSLSRGYCPNCLAFQVFRRDLDKNLRICKLCKREYPLIA